MFVSPAYAQAASPLGSLGGIEQFLPLVLIFAVFYFLLIRPQQKRAKVLKEMVNALRRGDRVVTTGGILGTVSKVSSDSEVLLEIADGVRVRVMRNAVAEVLTKGEPVAGGKDDADKAKEEGPAAPEEKGGSALGKLLGGKSK